MKAEERREAIAAALRTDQAISATTLAHRFSVSRQIIVGDIALLRAGGMEIAATPRGYKLGMNSGLERVVACGHDQEGLEPELLAMVDNGCTVIDVVVEHPLYGEITGQLSLSSRYDVERFVEKSREATPLSALTDGLHIHHLRCPDEGAYERVCRALDQLGVLYHPDHEEKDDSEEPE